MKNWHEQEASFYFRPRKSADLWQYIPKKLYPAVEDVMIDSDGYWVYLKEGWSAYDHGSDCTIIHEYNIKNLREAVSTIANYIERRENSMSAIDKALEATHSYELTNEECMALCGAIEYRIRFLKGVIDNEADTNPGMVEAAEVDKNHLEHIFSKLGF